MWRFPTPSSLFSAGVCEGVAMVERPPPGPPVTFCQDSPKRVLVSVIKTTSIKPLSRGTGDEPALPPPVPISPGFSDFMVYPWRWGENAHNVTFSPGGSAASSFVQQPCGGPARACSGEEETCSPGSSSSGSHLKVSVAGTGQAAGRDGVNSATPVRAARSRWGGKVLHYGRAERQS